MIDIIDDNNNSNDVNVSYGTGFIESKLDGTEHIVNIDDLIELPSAWSWQEAMIPVEDQGQTSQCVIYSTTSVLNFLIDSENDTPNTDNHFDKLALYNTRANKHIEGMSFKEILRYYRHTGANGYNINSYAKINSALAAKYSIVMFGPIVAGLMVRNFGPYFWRNTGGMHHGGHAITLVGYNEQGFILRNSWGIRWGDQGHSILGYDEFDQILEAWTFML